MRANIDEHTTFPLNDPRCESGTASLKLAAEFTTYEPAEGAYTRSASRTVIFDGNAWESELIWQTVGLIIKEFGMGQEEVREALETALRKLSEPNQKF